MTTTMLSTTSITQRSTREGERARRPSTPKMIRALLGEGRPLRNWHRFVCSRTSQPYSVVATIFAAVKFEPTLSMTRRWCRGTRSRSTTKLLAGRTARLWSKPRPRQG
eukprot:scaffold385_cov305-Pinguiococcus_pyrenoidosus.AAC.30